MNTYEDLENQLKKIVSTPVGRRGFLKIAPLLLAGCATQLTSDRKREGDNTNQKTSMSFEDEKNLTKEALPEMKKDYPPVNNPQLQNYISAIGNKIVRANNLHENPYTYSFQVVGVPYINAFALPAGTIFVTAPLLAYAETEAELAGVIGHEIGHVKARHTAERMEASKKNKNKELLYTLGGGLLGGAAGFGLGKLLCSKNQNDECLKRVTTLGLAAGAGGAYLIQKYAYMANSREDEMEADRIGFRTSVKSEYSKEHVGLFYEKLLKMEEERGGEGDPLFASLADAMSTHPPGKERVKQMKEMANSESPQQSPIISTPDFVQMKKISQEWVAANPPRKA
jgi:predicted Zn-dependent protease